MSSYIIKRTLSYLCGLPFWHCTQVSLAFQVERKSSYLKGVRQLPQCQSFLGSPRFGTAGINTSNQWLTCMQINRATIFVDYHSNHVYVFLMQDLTLNETILAKHTYERFLSSIGVTLKAYHADNGLFTDKGFYDDCTSCNQVITFCSVGSHHQNNIAEQKIKELTLGGQTLLLHAKRMLLGYISTIYGPLHSSAAKIA
jgi:hypothetical protein